MTNTPALLQPFLATLSRFAMRAFSWNQMLAPTIGRPSISRGRSRGPAPLQVRITTARQSTRRAADTTARWVQLPRGLRAGKHGGCNFPGVAGGADFLSTERPDSRVMCGRPPGRRERMQPRQNLSPVAAN